MNANGPVVKTAYYAYTTVFTWRACVNPKIKKRTVGRALVHSALLLQIWYLPTFPLEMMWQQVTIIFICLVPSVQNFRFRTRYTASTVQNRLHFPHVFQLKISTQLFHKKRLLSGTGFRVETNLNSRILTTSKPRSIFS